jgi:hypothetical protein
MNQDLPNPVDTQSADCLLTLALPLALEEEMLDLLRQHPGLVPGFSVVHGYGLGADATLTTMMERVQGRARRVFVAMAMRSHDVPVLINHLRQALSAPEVFYWSVPLLASGSLA